MMTTPSVIRLLYICCIVFLQKLTFSYSIPLIRDTEIETAVKELAKPIFEAAKLSDIDLYIVNSPQVNAFTNGGKNLFLYTGLLLEETDPETVGAFSMYRTEETIKGITH